MDADSRRTVLMVIAIYHFIIGMPWIAIALWLLMATSDVSRSPFGGDLLAKYLLPLAILAGGVGAGYATTGWGLWHRRNWARASAITIAALILVGDIGLITSLPLASVTVGSLVYIAIEIAIIYFLFMPETATVFQGTGISSPEATCPHCFRTGIRPGMSICPYCRQSLLPAMIGGADPPVSSGRPAPVAQPKATQVGPPQGSTLAWLVIKSGPGAGKRLDIASDTEIGRDQRCQIRLDDDYVSRSHARVKYEDGQYFIYDLGSKTGTFVNGRQIQRLMLYDGSTIRLGQTALEFKRSAAR